VVTCFFWNTVYKLTADGHEASRGLFATAELLVFVLARAATHQYSSA